MRQVWKARDKEKKTKRDVISKGFFSLLTLLTKGVYLSVCVTVQKKGHTGQPLYRSDEQLRQCLPAALWLGLVDLYNKGISGTG